MDPLSQGALGAAAAMVLAKPERLGWAALLGGLSGMAPDLDVLIRSSTDTLLFLEVHRQFTHSLVFIPVGAMLCSLAAIPLTRGKIPLLWIYGFCFAGYATHGLLDACTSYGTQLLWPFSDLRIAWNLVSVIDPLFTVPLVTIGLAAASLRRPGLAFVAVAWALAYLSLGYAQRERAWQVAEELAAHRGHQATGLQVKPSFGNLLLWKSVYVSGDRFFVDAIRLGTSWRNFEGESTPRLDRTRDLPWLRADTQQALDLERFRWFSSGYVALDPLDSSRVIDVRYSMLPNQIRALWGIQFDPRAEPSAHAIYFTSRDTSAATRQEFLRMLRGSEPYLGAP